MFDRRSRTWIFGSALAAFLAMPAHAQWAVIDNAAVAQLVTEVQTLQQQLQTARAQLQQAQQTLAAMSGNRGMQNLLAGTVRNYLPSTWTDLQGALAGGGGAYAALATGVNGLQAANAVLTPERLATLSPTQSSQLLAARQTVALQQVVTRQALAASSARFASLQSLIATIPAASDPKAIFDLQARIGAEVAMLQNEQTKMQVLYQSTVAEQRAEQLAAREAAIATQGEFGRRFRPAP